MSLYRKKKKIKEDMGNVNLVVIHLKNLFNYKYYNKAIDFIMHINNIVYQVKGLPFKIQTVYVNKGNGLFLEEVYFEFDKSNYNSINES
ncbi:hypothetical protein DY138_02775 [Apilactobacillus timberlakei]|uniref:hypothetical protein n=1 Tax=Apilactobacillus timberlakei TaxID=2008380 RepID=UPI0011273A1A|nr:hypothetical protein [Apilactobacillus timberlakei]TPR19585.1 hypothetical protein DY138_02775 [Apilactobacillus timberlakei]TPR20562.1 hypothetical protein DY061_04415 [Apilactobacillus timberlakei]TPR22606.1 hypothetical protein DY083_03685 [Apilactobacillus timberlakei]